MVSLKPHVEEYCKRELTRLGFSEREIQRLDSNIQIAICLEYGGKATVEQKGEIMQKYDIREDVG